MMALAASALLGLGSGCTQTRGLRSKREILQHDQPSPTLSSSPLLCLSLCCVLPTAPPSLMQRCACPALFRAVYCAPYYAPASFHTPNHNQPTPIYNKHAAPRYCLHAQPSVTAVKIAPRRVPWYVRPCNQPRRLCNRSPVVTG